MKSGIIKLYRVGQGYGIIRPDDGGADVFMHFSTITDPNVKARMMTGLPVLYEDTEDARGVKTTAVWMDECFTIMHLPAHRCGGNSVAVRNDKTGEVEVFMDRVNARKWIDLNRVK